MMMRTDEQQCCIVITTIIISHDSITRRSCVCLHTWSYHSPYMWENRFMYNFLLLEHRKNRNCVSLFQWKNDSLQASCLVFVINILKVIYISLFTLRNTASLYFTYLYVHHNASLLFMSAYCCLYTHLNYSSSIVHMRVLYVCLSLLFPLLALLFYSLS